MKKLPFFLVSNLLLLLCSCSPSADDYFGKAALNCNNFAKFGSAEMRDYLTQKFQIYDYDKKEYRMATTFQECFNSRFVTVAEKNYKEVKDLPVTEDTKSMITAVLALYDYVLPKMKNEYLQIAKLRDDNQPDTVIQKALTEFDQKYLAEFEAKYNKAWQEGEAYAKRHDIKLLNIGSPE